MKEYIKSVLYLLIPLFITLLLSIWIIIDREYDLAIIYNQYKYYHK